MNELLTAFDALSRTHLIKLLLTGMLETELDPLDAESMQIIEHNPSVINLGYQHDVRVPLAASDIFVFPSYREGFPNVVMQAMCMEVPCIVSDINGCNELIKHEESGLIIPVKQVEALKHAMLWMIGNREERLKFASRARAWVVEHFEQQHVWELLLQEYREMLQIKN